MIKDQFNHTQKNGGMNVDDVNMANNNFLLQY